MKEPHQTYQKVWVERHSVKGEIPAEQFNRLGLVGEAAWVL